MRVTPTFCAAAGGFLVVAHLLTEAGAGPECVARFIGDFPCVLRQLGVLVGGSVVVCTALTAAMRRHGLGRALAGSVVCPALGVAVGVYLGNAVGARSELVTAVAVGALVSGWDLVMPDARPGSPG